MDRFSVGLSLRGEGRVVVLRPQTIRTAFRQFHESTHKRGGEMAYQLRHAWLTDSNQPIPVHERLLSRCKGTLSDREVARIERHLSALAIRHEWRLTSQQAMVQAGWVAKSSGPNDRRRSAGILFNGACFEVRIISCAELLTGGVRDVFLEDVQHDLQFMRFHGVETSRVFGGLGARLSSRYLVSESHLERLATFRPRRVFSILRAQPLPGFHFEECAPFLTGR